MQTYTVSSFRNQVVLLTGPHRVNSTLSTSVYLLPLIEYANPGPDMRSRWFVQRSHLPFLNGRVHVISRILHISVCRAEAVQAHNGKLAQPQTPVHSGSHRTGSQCTHSGRNPCSCDFLGHATSGLFRERRDELHCTQEGEQRLETGHSCKCRPETIEMRARKPKPSGGRHSHVPILKDSHVMFRNVLQPGPGDHTSDRIKMKYS